MSEESPNLRTKAALLQNRVAGAVLLPGEEGYDLSRSVWNGRFDSHPALVVRCAGASDVESAVRFAVDQGLPLCIKGGGHDYAGNTVADGSVLVDLGRIDRIEIDSERRLASVGAGARWGDVDAATLPLGLATPAGTVSTVGVSGFTLGGGEGWLTRKHGMAVDNLVGATVVTAAGERVRASARHNPDLFWAIRGGGGNFGIVTSFEYTLHQVETELLAGQVLYPLDRAREGLRLYRDVFLDAPDELACFPFFIRVPPIDPFPEAFHGQLALDFVVAYAGPIEDAAQHLAPFRELGDPIADFIAPQPYLTLQRSFDAAMGAGNRWYSKSLHFDKLSDAAIDACIQYLEPFPGELSMVYFGAQGGYPSRLATAATAYPHRSSAHELHIFPGWVEADDDPQIMAWADAFYEAMRPHGNGGVYVNLLGDGEAGRVPEAYARNYPRLAALKRKWDPENLFRGNHNIAPSG